VLGMSHLPNDRSNYGDEIPYFLKRKHKNEAKHEKVSVNLLPLHTKKGTNTNTNTKQN